MSQRYRYDKPPTKHRVQKLIKLGVVLVIVTGILSLISFEIFKLTTGNQKHVSGPTKTVAQVSSVKSSQQKFSETDFQISLPPTWELYSYVSNTQEISYTFEPTKVSSRVRWLTIYVDKIPSTIDINYLLPLTSNGSGFSYGSLSDNCYDFVKSTPLEASIIATWENINFLCDLPTHIADVVGTGSVGQPINESVATGTYDGTHKYFFEYTDDSIQPDYSYLYSAIDNFSAR